LGKKDLADLIDICFRTAGNKKTVILADRLMQTGFREAMRAGISISVHDMVMPEEKTKLLDIAYEQVREIENQYVEGLITDGERYNKVIDIWAQTSEQIASAMMKGLSTDKFQAPEGWQGKEKQVEGPSFNSV